MVAGCLVGQGLSGLRDGRRHAGWGYGSDLRGGSGGEGGESWEGKLHPNSVGFDVWLPFFVCRFFGTFCCVFLLLLVHWSFLLVLSSCGFRALSSSLVFSSILFPPIAFAIGVLTSRLGVGDSRRMLLGLLLGVLMVVLDRGMGCGGGAWWQTSSRVSPIGVAFGAIGFLGVSLVVFDCVCGWGVLRGCCWWCLIAGVAGRCRGWMGCGWEVLRGMWLVVCYGVDFLVLWVSHICSWILQIQSDRGKSYSISSYLGSMLV